MKIQTSNSKINFNAGLTSKMKSEIAHCDIPKISNVFTKAGIVTDFKKNKTIAWCSLKTLEIIQELNKKFRLKLALPKGIIVEDFNNLKTSTKNSLGFCNSEPSELYFGNTIVPENVIFFNSFEKYQKDGINPLWDNLDSMSDFYYRDNVSATDFFLETFLHEFVHVMHQNNIVKKRGNERFLRAIPRIISEQYWINFKKKYHAGLSQICNYATTNPMEAVACDFSKRIIDSLDRNTLKPKYNFFKESPYSKRNLFNIFKDEPELNTALRNFWNGKFDI